MLWKPALSEFGEHAARLRAASGNLNSYIQELIFGDSLFPKMTARVLRADVVDREVIMGVASRR